MGFSINKSALLISLLYFLGGMYWLFISEKLFTAFQFADLSISEVIEGKVSISVALTALFIFGIIAHYSNRIMQLQADFRLAEAWKYSLMKDIPDVLLLINRNGLVVDHRNCENQQFHIQGKEFKGKMVAEFLPMEIARNYLHYIGRAVNTGVIQRYEYQLYDNEREDRYEVRIIPSLGDEVLSVIRNIDERKRLQDELEFLSLHDSLTGLYNRRYFEGEMMKLSTDITSLSGIIVCDVDGLKLINDILGHPAGDDLIKAVASVLRSCFDDKAVVARIGGDEFAVILYGTDCFSVEQSGEHILKTVEAHNRATPSNPVSISVGWAIPSERYSDARDLFKEADSRMYKEKLQRRKNPKSDMVQALINALDARDYITDGHGERLQDLVSSMAQRINLSRQVCADLRLFSKFHDVGKVGIPDTILFKAGALTPEEYAIMQRHCEIGYRIAQSVPDLAPIEEWILKHHERWDGQGYPLELKCEEIPVECRILALADAYDAMTHDRPYRKAMGYEAALAEIRQNAGKQFDPFLAKLFVEMIVQRADPVI